MDTDDKSIDSIQHGSNSLDVHVATLTSTTATLESDAQRSDNIVSLNRRHDHSYPNTGDNRLTPVNIADLFYSEAPPGSLWKRLLANVMIFVAEILECLSHTNETVPVEKANVRTPLNLFDLNRNVRRCYDECQPYLETFLGLRDLFLWRNPLSTLLLFWTFLYCIYRGCLISVFLFLILFQMLLNYFNHCCGISFGINILPRRHCTKNISESIPQGSQLISEVARQVQLYLHYGAETLEKFKSLLIWENPNLTFRFCLIVVFYFVLSILLTTSQFLTFLGFGIAGKLFIMQYLYFRFPRLRHQLDLIVWFYDRLPSHVANRSAEASMQGSSSMHKVDVNSATTESNHIQDQKLYSVKNNNGKCAWHCVLLDKQKRFPYVVGTGRMYISKRHICFDYVPVRSTKSTSFSIEFGKILTITKGRLVKYFSFNDGMAIEVYTVGRQKPYVFAGIVDRDDCMQYLLAVADEAGYRWSL
ncbi:GRAM domain-containing protein 4 [Trichinella papuae]|uniref:GRAM domain-containing protein 4 n=1 Tax=Trichinella papuae TaxID=268474 RepID=A0A0V1MNP9_9BILA|nr:GRAM domain-containing protein 4 [Trichinella papuae]KRZ73442.1 GRAM domain-containing protein 4 [Trichinella papuae]